MPWGSPTPVSNLTEIRQAYERLMDLLDQEILNRKGEATELRRFRKWLDTAFYLLGWANFENLTRKEAEKIISINASSKSPEGHAWVFLKEGIKNFSVRKRLELIFHGNHKKISSLNKDYDVRNDAAHDYKRLPPEVSDLANVLQDWEDLVETF